MIVGLGMDLVAIARVQRLLDEKGQRAIDRLFTEREVLYAHARARPAMHLAARLAAKEAAFKALAGSDGARLIGWREIEVVPRPQGPPTLLLHGRAEFRMREMEVQHVHLTLTHTDDVAGAVVVLER